jgi:hypothetical protein
MSILYRVLKAFLFNGTGGSVFFVHAERSWSIRQAYDWVIMSIRTYL